ncbi:hypothetical protein B0H11DRAFT_1927787 [Mycena galericulata]|nr:hypothetical protein B0H11DRAFT_1927787 [Mycena galericulata]
MLNLRADENAKTGLLCSAASSTKTSPRAFLDLNSEEIDHSSLVWINRVGRSIISWHHIDGARWGPGWRIASAAKPSSPHLPNSFLGPKTLGIGLTTVLRLWMERVPRSGIVYGDRRGLPRHRDVLLPVLELELEEPESKARRDSRTPSGWMQSDPDPLQESAYSRSGWVFSLHHRKKQILMKGKFDPKPSETRTHAEAFYSGTWHLGLSLVMQKPEINGEFRYSQRRFLN